MKKIKVLVLFLIVLMITGSTGSLLASAEAPRAKELKVDELFDGKEGTTVIKNLKSDKMYIYNDERSKIRFTPESTFKVPNALIGLEEKAVKDEYEVKRWDGVVREFETWNTDHSLASAMRYSAIWFYQDMARDIGMECSKTCLKPAMETMIFPGELIHSG